HIEILTEDRLRKVGEQRCCQGPSLPRSLRWGSHDAVRQPVHLSHCPGHARSRQPPSWGQRPLEVIQRRIVPRRLGVAVKEKASHYRDPLSYCRRCRRGLLLCYSALVKHSFSRKGSCYWRRSPFKQEVET